MKAYGTPQYTHTHTHRRVAHPGLIERGGGGAGVERGL